MHVTLYYLKYRYVFYVLIQPFGCHTTQVKDLLWTGTLQNTYSFHGELRMGGPAR